MDYEKQEYFEYNDPLYSDNTETVNLLMSDKPKSTWGGEVKTLDLENEAFIENSSKID